MEPRSSRLLVRRRHRRTHCRCAKCGSRKSDSSTMEIRARFGATIEPALPGRARHWVGDTDGTLALILLLDQFTRNVFRETPRAFAGDIAARWAHARALVYSGRRPAIRADASAGSSTCRSSIRRTSSTSTSRCGCSQSLADDGLNRSADMGAEAFRSDPAVRSFPPSQRHTGPRLDARGGRVPQAARFAVLNREHRGDVLRARAG